MLRELNISLLMTAALSVNAIAYEQSKDSHDNSALSDNVEHIQVLGEQTLRSLRSQAIRAKKDFYELYNELEQDREFKIVCKNDAGNSASSRIKKESCSPNYYRDARSELQQRTMSSMFATGILTTPGAMEVNARVRKKDKEAKQRIADLINSNEELNQKFLAYMGKSNEYKEMHRQEFGERSKY